MGAMKNMMIDAENLANEYGQDVLDTMWAIEKWLRENRNVNISQQGTRTVVQINGEYFLGKSLAHAVRIAKEALK